MTVRLTKRVIDGLGSGKRQDVFDADLPGFLVRVSAAGEKTYAFQYRVGGRGGPMRKVTIGRHGLPWAGPDGTVETLTVDRARKEAERLRGLVSTGADPRGEAVAAKSAPALPSVETVESILTDFKTRHLARNRSGDEMGRLLARELLPTLGHRPIADVTRLEIARVLDTIADRGATYQRNRTAAMVRKLFNFAVDRGALAMNPAARIGMLQEEKRDRVLSDAEIRAFWHATEAVNLVPRTLLQALLLTAQRRDEVAGMRWSGLTLDGARPLWSIPKEAAKNGQAHDVPLSPAVVELLSGLPRMRDSEFAFTTTGKTPFSGFSKVKKALDGSMTALIAEGVPAGSAEPLLRPWRFHDLRRTAATGMARLGSAVHVVEKVLNHASGSMAGVAGIYNRHAYLEERRHALTEWADDVDRIVRGVATCETANPCLDEE